jgi:hypothetical protein
MTANVLERPASHQVALFTSDTFSQGFRSTFEKGTTEEGADTLIVKNVAIFRSGEFSDSMGYEHVWTDFHIQAMESNFNLLFSSGTFKDVPVRAGHPELFSNNMKNLIGYITAVYATKATNPIDGEEYTYLMADYEILDPEAITKITSGLWRNRSSEVGFYVANNRAEYWPCIVGFAYVDIPAVEGLNFSKYAGNGTEYTIVDATKEVGQVATETKQENGQAQAPASAVPAVTPEVSAHAAPPAVPQVPAVSAPKFFVNGSEISDPKLVQDHITELEQFAKETKEASRKAFVNGLVEKNKIFAIHRKSLEDLALSLNDEQYGHFTASYADAPEIPLLGNHSVQPEAGGTPSGQGGAPDPQVEKARRIYNRHVQANMPAAQLAETPSAKLLKEKGII